MIKSRALWMIARGVAELRTADLPEAGPDTVTIRTLFSGLSRGTERLVFNGAVPPSEYGRMGAPLMEGAFPFPVKYGYAAIGLVETGPAALMGKTVFALGPHQDRQVVPTGFIAVVPENVPARRAVLTANMETALNAVWDSGAGPGDRIVVVGAGIVGLLIARIVARLPGSAVTVVDPDADRSAIVTQLGATFAKPGDAPGGADVVFHASATSAGLATALNAAGFEGTVVEVSWFGEAPVSVPLGGAFHSQRLKLISTQVGAIAPSRRARWDYARRRDAALALLADEALDSLLTEEITFDTLPEALPRLLAPGAKGLQTIIRY